MKEIINETINFIRETNDYELIREKLIAFHPADLNTIFSKFTKEIRLKVYEALSDDDLATVFSYLDNPEKFLEDLSLKRVAAILDEMEIDDVNDILDEVEDEALKALYIESLSSKRKLELQYTSTIKEDRVGRIMSTNYIVVDASSDVKDAMKRLIKEADESEIIDPIFVTENDKFLGVLSLNDLIIARSPKQIKDIIEDKPVSVNVDETIINATKIIRNYSLNALPILDDGTLVGILTSDDAFELYSDIVDTQYAGLAAVSSDDLDDKRFFKRLLERLPWLIALLILGIITTNLLSTFEDIIEQVTILVMFQILILDMAGNVGTQSLAVTIISLVHNDNQMTKKQTWKHIGKEVLINVFNSFLLMIISFIVSYVFISFYPTEHSAVKLAFTISLSMGLTLIISAFFGAMLPILFSKIKVNPAVASGPLITTINDIVAILIYFNLAALLFGLY